MKSHRITTLSVLCILAATWCWGQNKQWDKRFGGSDIDSCSAVQQTSDGGYILAGTSQSGVSGDKTQASRGGKDYWVVKVDANGTKQWDRRFGGDGEDVASSVQQTADGGYIIGGTSYSGASGDKTEASRGAGDYWIVKVNSSGTRQWDRRFGGSAEDTCASVRQTSDGGYILAGTSYSGANGDKTEASRGGSDYWIVKVDANGIRQWDRRFGGTNFDSLRDIQQTSDGGYILAGDSDSGLNGDKTETSRGWFDFWVVKVSANGTKQWDRRFGGTGGDYCYAVQQTRDGGYILAGNSQSGANGDKTEDTQGGFDYWFVKVNSSGSKEWDRRFGGGQDDHANSVQQTSDGGYVIGGYTMSGATGDKTEASRGSLDYWVVKTDAAGAKQWDKRFGGSSADTLYALQQTSDGGYILAGNSQSGANGDKTESLRGAVDYWIVKLRGTTASVQRWDTLQPIAGYTANRWAFLTAWNLATDGFEASGNWRNGAHQWDHDATGYNQWVARFVYDQASMQTRALAWYYRQIHVQ